MIHSVKRTKLVFLYLVLCTQILHLGTLFYFVLIQLHFERKGIYSRPSPLCPFPLSFADNANFTPESINNAGLFN